MTSKEGDDNDDEAPHEEEDTAAVPPSTVHSPVSREGVKRDCQSHFMVVMQKR